jgi:phage terminase large subunit-like protein
VHFFAEVLVHTKGIWAGKQFVLEPWQEFEIIRPLFGEVVWDPELRTYVRRYRLAYIIVGRKNGKSEIAAGIVLYLLVGDDEPGAEVYGAAKDTKQAGKVAHVVDQMRKRSPLLNGDRRGGRLKFNKNNRRIFDLKTDSFFEVITADALGELGHNPHGSYIDEVLSQPDDTLFHALRTAMGARHQPMMLVISTETNNPTGFGASEIDEAEKVQEDPKRAPHIFAYVRKTPCTRDELRAVRRQFKGHPNLPVSLDPFDERNWFWANPALGSFKRIATMREEAIEAQNEPAKENPFRQFQLNQRQQQTTRWMSIRAYDASAGLVVEEQLRGRQCWGGLDLASTTDLAAWVLIFPGSTGVEVLYRFWTPEVQVPELDKHLGGAASVWVREGRLHATEGDFIDFDAIHAQLLEDQHNFDIVTVGFDPANAAATASFMATNGFEVEPVYQGYNLSGALKEIMRLVRSKRWRHGGHPVARWNAESAEVRQNDEEKIKLVKPARQATGARVDGLAASATAVHLWQRYELEESALPATGTGGAAVAAGGNPFRPTERLRI